MPRFPDFSDRVSAIENSVFEKYSSLFRRPGKKVVPLHLGDTYLPPAYDLPIDKKFLQNNRFQNRYCNTYGVSALRRTLADKVNSDNGFNVTSEEIMISAGAVNGLNGTVFSVMDPGEEILVLTPCWPFFMGIVKSYGGIIKEVPIYDKLYENANFNIEEYLEEFLTPSTVAVYLNSPNNPTGKVLSAEQLKAVAAFVKKHNLWLISDEAYESFVYDDLQHHSIAAISDIFPQTVTVFSFAKMFMIAGYRLGYLAAAKTVLQNINKVLVHQVYNAPSVLQYMLIEPVKKRHEWLPAVRKRYRELRDIAVETIDIQVRVPEAGYYLFFSLRPYSEKIPADKLFEKILEEGTALTPGSSFGKDFPDHVRLCFTSVPEEKLIEGIHIVNSVLKNIKV